MSERQSIPEARDCWICGAAKVVLKVVKAFPHRMCRNCDAPDNRRATWDKPAAGEVTE